MERTTHGGGIHIHRRTHAKEHIRKGDIVTGESHMNGHTHGWGHIQKDIRISMTHTPGKANTLRGHTHGENML